MFKMARVHPNNLASTHIEYLTNTLMPHIAPAVPYRPAQTPSQRAEPSPHRTPENLGKSRPSSAGPAGRSRADLRPPPKLAILAPRRSRARTEIKYSRVAGIVSRGLQATVCGDYNASTWQVIDGPLTGMGAQAPPS